MVVDFSAMFKDIRESMNIKEELYTREIRDFTNSDSIDIGFLDYGEGRIKLEQLDNEMRDRVLRVDGTKVYLYVTDDILGSGRYHIAWCSTIRGMYRGNRIGPYVVSRRTDCFSSAGYKLHICKNCLTALDFNGYKGVSSAERNKIFDEFNIRHFLTQ